MGTKHFEHAEKTIEYIMAYLLSLPATVEKTTRRITDVVGANMRQDGLEPARAIGYLLKKLEVSGQVERRGQQFWKAVRTPLDNGYSREQVQLAICQAGSKLATAKSLLTEAIGELFIANEKMNERQPTQQQKLGLGVDLTVLNDIVYKKTPDAPPQADDSGGIPTSVKTDD